MAYAVIISDDLHKELTEVTARIHRDRRNNQNSFQDLLLCLAETVVSKSTAVPVVGTDDAVRVGDIIETCDNVVVDGKFVGFANVERQFLYPAKMTNDMGRILSTMAYQCSGLAMLIRTLGGHVGHRAEDEQASVIHYLLCKYLSDPKGWRGLVSADFSLAKQIEEERKRTRQENAGADPTF